MKDHNLQAINAGRDQAGIQIVRTVLRLDIKLLLLRMENQHTFFMKSSTRFQ